ncbi:Hypothetical_protein [Hexamita inflata]|uniref:Hypothetical_protein n=1 Tax=Hexamita inflata TaxID=28002 RepID=A0AA86QWJ1_9EUKA|nr:Hypothetical protein HINF_LOCUS48698 [Hexamita inflata]
MTLQQFQNVFSTKFSYRIILSIFAPRYQLLPGTQIVLRSGICQILLRPTASQRFESAYKHLDSSEIVGFYKLSFMQLKNGKLVLNKVSDVNNTLQACFYIVVGKEFVCSEVIYQFL